MPAAPAPAAPDSQATIHDSDDEATIHDSASDEGELMPESPLGDALMRGDVLILVDAFNVLFPPVFVVISDKESRVPPWPGASSLYIQTTPLRNVAHVPMEWRHIDEHLVETEVLELAVPRLFRLYKENVYSPSDAEKLLCVLLEAVMAAAGYEEDTAEAMWSQMVPSMSLAEAMMSAHATATAPAAP